jgi:hypothetical protein
MTILPTLLLALIPTILIEFVVLLLLRERNRLVLGSSVVINILTNIPLNLFAFYIDYRVILIVLGELLVIVVEAFWYFLFLHNLSRAFIYSSLCNAISFLTGLLAILLIVFFQII